MTPSEQIGKPVGSGTRHYNTLLWFTCTCWSSPGHCRGSTLHLTTMGAGGRSQTAFEPGCHFQDAAQTNIGQNCQDLLFCWKKMRKSFKLWTQNKRRKFWTSRCPTSEFKPIPVDSLTPPSHNCCVQAGACTFLLRKVRHHQSEGLPRHLTPTAGFMHCILHSRRLSLSLSFCPSLPPSLSRSHQCILLQVLRGHLVDFSLDIFPTKRRPAAHLTPQQGPSPALNTPGVYTKLIYNLSWMICTD